MSRRVRGGAEGAGVEPRQGFTTGSAAAAAAKGALTLLLSGRILEKADIPLPPGGRLDVPVAHARLEGPGARAVVVKEAGDDPDATHGARIACLAVFEPGPAPAVRLEGGRGVGRVTLPGLPVPVGRAAINPAPRAQIEAAALEVLAEAGVSGLASLLVEVEDGEALARRTLNPRLGIVGGISILGTQGTVKPFSHAAWQATIDSSLAVARAAGLDTAALATGRRSERLLMARLPGLPELAFVQAADFFAHSLREARNQGFREIVWGCFFGKLAKMAQGQEYTHARSGDTDFALLAGLARDAGAGEAAARAVGLANTARHALELVPQELRAAFAGLALERALRVAGGFLETGARRGETAPRVGIVCFGFDELVLCEGYTS